MSQGFLSTENLPFCAGCGHGLIARSIEKALQRLEHLTPLDLVVVTDIGCIGIIDKQFNAHTVHGLHGRSVALATGISMGLSNPRKKILVLLGDGGATIGLHHIIEAAHRNIDMTVIVNNMLYGMTGGAALGAHALRLQDINDARGQARQRHGHRQDGPRHRRGLRPQDHRGGRRDRRAGGGAEG
jgi:pyruvate/2-oxoacid:ferredoxin oxidoreductase beta subunit